MWECVFAADSHTGGHDHSCMTCFTQCRVIRGSTLCAWTQGQKETDFCFSFFVFFPASTVIAFESLKRPNWR